MPNTWCRVSNKQIERSLYRSRSFSGNALDVENNSLSKIHSANKSALMHSAIAENNLIVDVLKVADALGSSNTESRPG
jgi:hypothetical protein